MLFNYTIGNSLNGNFLHQKISKKSLLTLGIVANLLLLGYFKYSDFFIENFNVAFGTSYSLLHLMLPLAISFFTFQQIAYLVDSYRQETKEYDFINYALFVTFFPQLIAGPIVHHKEMMPQFASHWNMVKKYKNIALGLFIFSIGLFKKVVIADTFALWATTGFDHTTVLGFYEAWATSLSYTFQLYFDFSGYTDMAIGAALLFNIKLPINFFSPYKALSIQDFWRRWHITLSRFLKDYIYIPLGGNRKGSVRTYANLITTFILGGLWHGAGWTFLFWGLLHGLALAIHRFWKYLGFKIPKILAWFITFQFVNVAWVFFRAKEWEDALKILKGMIDIQSLKTLEPFKHIDTERVLALNTFIEFNILYYTSSLLILGFVISTLLPNTHQLREKFHLKKETSIFDVLFIGALLGFALIVTVASTGSEFLYFNF